MAGFRISGQGGAKGVAHFPQGRFQGVPIGNGLGYVGRRDQVTAILVQFDSYGIEVTHHSVLEILGPEAELGAHRPQQPLADLLFSVFQRGEAVTKVQAAMAAFSMGFETD